MKTLIGKSKKLLTDKNCQNVRRPKVNLRSTVFRSKYLDWLTFYKTNDIFKDFADYISDILNEKQIEVDDIFDCIEMSDEIKNMALQS